MELRVLGSSGSTLTDARPASILLGEEVLIDAGSVAAALSLEDQLRIRHVLLTHAHLDHVRDLPALAENFFGRGRFVVHATAGTIEALRRHILNDVIWPDFSSLPDEREPVLSYDPFTPREPFEVVGLSVTAVPVDHPGGSVAFLVDDGNGTVVFSGDTGPTDALWREVNRRTVRALLVETSFPNRLQELADVSGHLTPNTLVGELAKFEHEVPIFIHSIKAPTAEETREELRGLLGDQVRFLDDETVLEL